MLLIIIWLMDVPSPFMEILTDKIAVVDSWCHLIIGAALTFTLAFDWQRRHKWKAVPVPLLLLFLVIAWTLTAICEYVQSFTPEEYRRVFDWWDIASQGAGAVGMGVAYSFVQLLWCKKPSSEKA